jgi:formamidopyrimidine-DNA glycosylase
MPELPEVEVVRRGLAPYLTGSLVTSVEVLHPRAVRRNLGMFEQQLNGATLTRIGRRGKYMWFELDRPESVIVHLGMSGQFRVHPFEGVEKFRQHPHLRVRMAVSAPTGMQWEVHFLDQRTFGGMHLSGMEISDHGEVIPTAVQSISRDPFDERFDPERVIARAKRSQSAIKRVLLNQSIISGVGNIYADESLFRSGIHGDTRAADIRVDHLRRLVTNVTEVMNEALEQGGTSFDSLYVHVNGESGYFARSLSVYGREGEACDTCGTLIKRKKFTNRSSFYCPKCQEISPAVARA